MPTPTGPRVPLIGSAELRDHLEDALDQWFAGTRGWLSAFDLIRRPSELVLRAAVPGVKFDDVRIEVDAATLTISGERPEPDEAEDASYLRRLEDGGLEVTLPLRPGSDTEPIQIRPSQ